jgi:hypothetical protein
MPTGRAVDLGRLAQMLALLASAISRGACLAATPHYAYASFQAARLLAASLANILLETKEVERPQD